MNQFCYAIILMWYIRNIYILFFINWTLHMGDNLPERVQILCHAHIICITILENRIICCQVFGDLLLKSACERIFNVMQLILVNIKWHMKWKYLIQNFHDICLSYYFKTHNYDAEVTMSYLPYLCLFTYSGFQHILCRVVLRLIYVASFYGLSIFDCPFGIL
jgi:hypothetical protein